MDAGSATPPTEERRQLLRGIAGAGAVLAWPALTQAAESRPADPRPVESGGSAADTSAMEPLDLSYAGYLISGVGATPLASARLQATQQGDRYQIELRVESFLADLTYKSRGLIGETGLKPLEYQEMRKVAFRREREKSALYIHTDDVARQNTRVGQQLYVPDGAQDRLSLILQVIWMARRNPDLLVNDVELSLPFARVDNVTESRWHVRGPERLQRAETDQPATLSSQHGFRITRVADAKDTVDVAFWLSAQQPRRPLVLQFSEKGRSLRFVHDSV